GVVRQADDGAFAERARRRVLDRLARRLVDDAEDRLERPALRFVAAPAGERLGDGIETADAAVEVGCDHRIADALERDAQALALRGDQRFGLVAAAQVP